jgi:hypothetical protein
MKRFLFKSGWVCLLSAMAITSQAQDRQMGDTTYYKTLIPETKQTLLKNMSFIANMRFANQNEFVDGEFTKSRFVNQQFRLELRGYVTDKVFFRLRDRYTRAQTSESVDNLSRSVDMAYIRVDMTKKWSLSAGKMCADWGAWEFDYNPIDVYEYSDIIEYADNFLTGVGMSYNATPKHQFTVQALDSRTKTFTELYDTVPGLVESKVPLAFVFNWRGSLFGDKVKTIWSYSLFNEAKNTNMNYVALGTELTLGKFVIVYDYKWSDEQLDRTGLVSTIVPDTAYNYALKNTNYVGHWVHLHYRVTPKINLAIFGMLDIASWKNSASTGGNTTGSNVITRNWGYIPTIEYYPFPDLNLRFFLNYVGRIYDYSEYAEKRLGAKDYSTGRLQIGFVSPLGVF